MSNSCHALLVVIIERHLHQVYIRFSNAQEKGISKVRWRLIIEIIRLDIKSFESRNPPIAGETYYSYLYQIKNFLIGICNQQNGIKEKKLLFVYSLRLILISRRR